MASQGHHRLDRTVVRADIWRRAGAEYSAVEFRNSLVPARNTRPDRRALRANKEDNPR